MPAGMRPGLLQFMPGCAGAKHLCRLEKNRLAPAPVVQVHRYHPPLIYGRTMGGVPEQSEGCAMCRVEGASGPVYGIITYQ